MAADLLEYPWDFDNHDRSWEGLLLLIEDLARVPTLTEDEVDTYVIVSRARLHDRDHIHNLPALPVEKLGVREAECLVWMSLGKENKEIAEAMAVSLETVKTMGRNIFRKLAAHDRAHAVAIGLRRGLIE